MTRGGARLGAVLGLAVVLGSGAGARADAIEAPPAACPEGSVGESSHEGTWCEATTCQSDADCAGHGQWPEPRRHYVCRQTELCVRTETYTRSLRMPLPEGQAPPTLTRSIGVGACGSGCVAPAACTNAMRCVEQTSVASVARGVSRNVGTGCGSCALARREDERTVGLAIGGAFVAAALGMARTWRRR